MVTLVTLSMKKFAPPEPLSATLSMNSPEIKTLVKPALKKFAPPDLLATLFLKIQFII